MAVVRPTAAIPWLLRHRTRQAPAHASLMSAAPPTSYPTARRLVAGSNTRHDVAILRFSRKRRRRAADSLPHDLLCCLRIPFPTNQCTMASDGKAEEVVAPKAVDADEEVFIMTIRFHVRCLPAWRWRVGALVGWLVAHLCGSSYRSLMATARHCTCYLHAGYVLLAPHSRTPAGVWL